MDSLASPGDSGAQSEASALRIGLLVDRREGLDNWQLRIIDRILEDSRFVLAPLMICPSPMEAQRSPLLLRLAARIERAILARQPAYHPKHFMLSELPFQPVSWTDEDDGPMPGEPDLVLCLSAGRSPDTVSARLPFGEWRFSFLDEACGHDDWSGYAGVIENRPATEMRIDIRFGGAPLEGTCVTAAFSTKFSAIRNSDFIKERAVTLLMRELRRLADTRRLPAPPEEEEARAPNPAPSARQLVRYGRGLCRNLVARGLQAMAERFGSVPIWALYLGEGQAPGFDPRKAVLIEPDKNEIRADPFLIEHQGQIYLFYEAYGPGDRKAHIAVSRLVGHRIERLGIALSRDYHLSYPFVFRHEGQLFMIPETNQARRLEVWRCVEFPLRWELFSTGLEGLSSADSTLTLFNGKWWLLTNLSDFHAYEDHCSELHVFEVDGPALNRLVPHKNNPVVIDSTVARNGGRPFEQAGRLYRPSQRNEYGIYGYGLNIMEIEQMDLETYRERCIRTILPDFAPGLVACHHLDVVAGRYVMDVMFGRSRHSPR